MPLTCIIIDDEPAARKGLAADVREIDYLDLRGLAANAPDALEMLVNYSPDLIFLDINMPGISGIEFLKLLKIKPIVIITSAYPQYAIDGYEYGVIDYLLKPVSAERLKSACDKALVWFNYRNPAHAATTSPYFYVKCNGRMERIVFDDVLYFEAANNYLFIHTAAKRYLTYHTLKGMEQQLPADKFVRVHKSFIVARDRIQQVTGEEVKINNVMIPLSRSFRGSFQADVLQPKSIRR